MEEDVPVTLCNLPIEVLASVAAALLPVDGLADTESAWRHFMQLSPTSYVLHFAAVTAMRERVPVALCGPDPTPAAFCAHVGALLAGGGTTRWQAVKPLRAVRAQTAHTTPLQLAPSLSGASLCAIAPQQLCLFGGRASTTGDTLDATHLITLRSNIAIWDTLLTSVHPPARCYHTATIWQGAPSMGSRRRGGGERPPMVVFGGAGDDGCENLLGDLWCATSAETASSRGLGRGGGDDAAGGLAGGAAPPLCWRRLKLAGPCPVERSSHICCSWEAGATLVVHGGLASDGVLGDTWLLRPAAGAAGAAGAGVELGATGAGTVATSEATAGAQDGEWVELHTSGASVKRAHHSGGVVSGSTLLVFSGQDETLITRHTLASLDLVTGVWALTALPTEGPCWSTRRQASLGAHAAACAPIARIDGAATAIGGVGLVVFGGVGDDFGFVPAADAWLLRHAADVRPTRQLASPSATRQPAAVSPSASDEGARDGAPAPLAPPPVGAPPVGPCSRACLALCAEGLQIHLFGGFDGEADLNDLWTLDLRPPPQASPSRAAGAPAFDVDVFKARQARASAVLHGTPGAAGHNSIGMPIHVLVGLAARDPACVDAASALGRGTLPLVPPTPLQAAGGPLASTPADMQEFDLSSGLGDGLGRGQRAAILAAFRGAA